MANERLRLTKAVTASGCAAKLGPGDLAKALAHLTPIADPRLLVGPDTMDDAAVLKISDDLAICFSTDFITPVVDDPADWGWIAAVNSLSDIYAMGGKPLAALNLVCWPKNLPGALLDEVLAGGSRATAEAGCMIVGGHTIEDKEPKYGLAVIGTVSPEKLLRNRGALPGDRLYLTKPLGTGIISTAIKADLAGPQEIQAALHSMKALNRAASEAAIAASARALTDVSGFGLMGHLVEMLGPAGPLGAEVSAGSLPLLPGVFRQISMGMCPAGTYHNRDGYRDRVRIANGTPEGLEMLLHDPQTSGGLLAAIPPETAEQFEEEAAQRGLEVSRIGRFTPSGLIQVVP